MTSEKPEISIYMIFQTRYLSPSDIDRQRPSPESNSGISDVDKSVPLGSLQLTSHIPFLQIMTVIAETTKCLHENRLKFSVPNIVPVTQGPLYAYGNDEYRSHFNCHFAT